MRRLTASYARACSCAARNSLGNENRPSEDPSEDYRLKADLRKRGERKRSKKESIKKETEKESSNVTAFVLENDSKRSADLYANWPSSNKD